MGTAARWLIDHGTWFTPTPRPPGVRKMRNKFCYRNALVFSIDHEDARYCEGWALTGTGPIQHAWVTYTGTDAVELTWATPGLAYVGTVIPDAVLHDQILTGSMSPVIGRVVNA